MTKTATDTKLNAARKAAGLSYTDLAKILNVSRPAAQKYCQGVRVPRRAPAAALRKWSKGAITIANFDEPAQAQRRARK